MLRSVKMFRLCALLSLVLVVICQAQQSDVDTYYSAIDPTLQDQAMKDQLFSLMNPHVVFTYDEAWAALDEIDKTLPTYPCAQNDTSKFPDVYSAYCWTNQVSVQGGECGEYKKEGDCWNREHIWPKSWFGGFDYGANAQTDLFELWSTDGYVNGMRSNWPLGEVSNTGKLYISSNGAKIGDCSSAEDNGQVGTCFEPAEMYKGPFARAYFYLSVTYMNQWTCCDTGNAKILTRTCTCRIHVYTYDVKIYIQYTITTTLLHKQPHFNKYTTNKQQNFSTLSLPPKKKTARICGISNLGWSLFFANGTTISP